MEIQTRKAFGDLLRGSWRATVGQRVNFWLFVVFYVVAYSLDLLVPWTIGFIIDDFLHLGFTDEAFHRFFLALGLYTGLRLGTTLFHHVARYLQSSVAYSSRMYTLSTMFNALMGFPLRWHVEHHSGETLSKLNRSAGSVESIVGTYIWQVIEGLVKVVGAGLALLFLDTWVAVNVLAMAGITVLMMILFNRRLTGRMRRNNIFNNKIGRICVDYLINVVTIKTLGLEESAKRHLKEQRDEGYELNRKVSKYMELMWGSTGLGYALVISSSLFIYFYGHQDMGKAFEAAPVYVLLNYVDRIFQAIGSFTGYYSGIVAAATSYEDASDILQQAAEQPSRIVRPVEPTWQKFSIQNLNFSYVFEEARGLKEINLDLSPRDKIALVGPSGGGKSTLLKVLGGLLKPDTYSFETDKQDALSLDDVASICLLIPQEPEIFSETVRYNLTMGDTFDPKELSFFISLCRLEEVLAKLPEGWESNLAEKGLNLSVGEKQRMALARGLLRASNKQMLLLDEPTSSLDPKTEKEIFLGLLYHFSDRTVITACHRLNLVPLFDKIIFLLQGQIVETGSFKELMDRKGYFYRAWEDYQNRSAKEAA